MGQHSCKGTSLGMAKRSFGEVLRDAIREEFKSNKRFAEAAGKTEGRVSQVINGPEVPEMATLDWVLDTFESAGLKEQIRRAWLDEFARPAFESTDLEDAEEVLRQINGLADQDPRLALKFAEEVRSRVTDAEAWQQTTERIVHLRLRLASPGSAAAAITEMERRAQVRNDSLDLLSALWMRGIALRNLESVPAKTLIATHQKAAEFAEAFLPSDGAVRKKWQNRRLQMDRDFALHVLSLHERKRLDEAPLRFALQSVDRSIQDGDDPAFYYMGMEVRARIELALGMVVKAEDTVDEIREQGLKYGAEVVEKTEITAARILAARNEKEEAIEKLRNIADYCLERTNLHHHRTADQLVLRLVEAL